MFFGLVAELECGRNKVCQKYLVISCLSWMEGHVLLNLLCFDVLGGTSLL